MTRVFEIADFGVEDDEDDEENAAVGTEEIGRTSMARVTIPPPRTKP